MRIGRFRIQRQIAEGGQGSVLLGYDPQLRRQVAIKLYRLPDQRERRRQALREARRSALLDSPRITRVYDVLVAGNDLAVIMEYVPGCDLRDVLSGTRLSLAASLSIASDIAAALAAARLREIVHGDIKPANILITAEGRAMLTDFGVAQVGDDPRATGVSRSALTPEHVRGERLCLASDMFALGVLIYRMVGGVSPFADGELGRQAMCEGRFVPLGESESPISGDVPVELEALVARLLSPDPRQRPGSIHAVRQALRNVALALPLGESTPVRAETQAFHRNESAADVPPALAAAFGDSSRRKQFRERLRSFVAKHPGRTAGGVALALASTALVWLLRPAPCVELEPPALSVDAPTAIAGDISREWLQNQLRQGISGYTPRVEISGVRGDTSAPQGTVRRERPDRCAADYRLQLRLDCRRNLCLLALLRDGRPGRAGVPLFADASIEEWRAAIDRVVTAAP